MRDWGQRGRFGGRDANHQSLALSGASPAGVLAGTVVPAAAQEACTPGPNALGVSRVAEIDTSHGPPFRLPIQGAGHPGRRRGGADLRRRAVALPTPSRCWRPWQAHCTKATFFVVGRMAVADPEMVREYARLGHTVGIHTWSHANLHSITPTQGAHRDRARLQRRAAGAGQAGGAVLPLPLPGRLQVDDDRICRSATSPSSPSTSTARTIAPAMPSTVHRKVMADLARAKKGIILFHDIQPSTARAIPAPAGGSEGQGLPRRASAAEGGGHDHAGVRRHRPAGAGPAAGIVSSEPLVKRSLTWQLTGEHAEPAVAKEPVRPQPPRPARLPRTTGSDRLPLVGRLQGCQTLRV